VTVYIPLREALPTRTALDIIRSYDVRPVRIYGFRTVRVEREGRTVTDREWMVAATEAEAQDMDAVYALDLATRPAEALKIAENSQVITVMLRR
jgi:hypothetical protein